MTEIWKDVPGYESIYEVSSLGRVRSVDRTISKRGNRGSTYSTVIKGRIRRQKLTKFGYLEIALSNGKRKDMSHLRMNRLVAVAFIPNPNNLPEVHHIDHDKTNNQVGNLRWVTSSENTKEAIKAGRHHGGFKVGVNHHNAKFTDDQILSMFSLEKAGLKRSEIADVIGCSRGYVTNILNDKKRACVAQIYGKTI